MPRRYRKRTDLDNFFTRAVDKRLDRLTDDASKRYIREAATRPDGSRDEPLAARIDMEVHRRGEMGKQLDIWEPTRWTLLSAIPAAAASAGLKHAEKYWEPSAKKVTRPVIYTLAASTAVGSVIQAVRFEPRYKAGLRGGFDVAVKMDAREKQGLNPPSNPDGTWQSRTTSRFEQLTHR